MHRQAIPLGYSAQGWHRRCDRSLLEFFEGHIVEDRPTFEVVVKAGHVPHPAEPRDPRFVALCCVFLPRRAHAPCTVGTAGGTINRLGCPNRRATHNGGMQQ